MRDTRKQQLRINGSGRTLEETANGDDSNYAIHAHEAMLDKSPFPIPTDQARVDFKSLKQLKIVAELGDRIAYDRERLMPARNRKNARTYEPMHPTNIGQRKISAVVDVEINVQVVWPNSQMDARGRKQVDFGFPDEA